MPKHNITWMLLKTELSRITPFCTFSPQMRPTALIMILSCIIVYCAADGDIYTLL